MKRKRTMLIVWSIISIFVVGFCIFRIASTTIFSSKDNTDSENNINENNNDNSNDGILEENIGNTNVSDNSSVATPDILYLDYIGQYELKVGNSVQIEAYNGSKSKVTNEVIWKSSDESVVTVSNGKVVGKKEGNATITVTSGNASTTLKIIVKKKDVINVNITNCDGGVNIKNGETKTLKYSVSPSTNKSAKWTSSNTGVATVNSDGKITAKGDGSTKITVTVDGRSSTCNVVVSTTYVATINKVSSKVDTGSKITEKLKVSVKDHKGTSITGGLSYKWYLNDNLISGANDSSYSSNKYGTYRVDVYKDGKNVTLASYYAKASPISYVKDTSSDTKFIFVNNPEPIEDSDLVDNGKVIYQTSFDKNMEMYFEHNRGTNTPFYYGIRIYNPTNKNVTLTINKSGISALHNGKKYHKVWEQYYSGNVIYRKDSSTGKVNLKTSYVLSPGQYLYLWMVQDLNMSGNVKFMATISNYKYAPYNDYLPSDAVPIDYSWSWAFDGVLNLTAKVDGGGYVSSVGGRLDIANIAVSKSFYKAENKDKINGASTLATKKHSQLTGEYAGKPLVTNSVTFNIDDSTPKGTLPTYYSTSSNANDLSLMSGWVTNLSGSSTSAYQRETIPLSGIATNGSRYTVTPFGSITTANYAVHYKENITIVNNGSKPRNVAFIVNTGSGTDSTAADTTWISFVTNGSNQVVKNAYKTNGVTINPNTTFDIFSKRTNVKVWSATVPAKTSITVPSINLVGGMSYANIIKMVCVDNSCYDSFYQKEFTW